MAGVARVGIDIIDSGPPVVIAGTLQATVVIAGAPVAIVGDAITSHGSSPHDASVISSGAGNVVIAGTPIARNGDSTTCGHTINSGAGNVVA